MKPLLRIAVARAPASQRGRRYIRLRRGKDLVASE